MKSWTEARNNKYMKYHSKLTYQLSFWNVSRKVDCHAGGKWFIHGPKRRNENQLVAKPETPLLIILNIAYKYDVHGNLFSALFEKQILGQKHHREVVKNRNSISPLTKWPHFADDVFRCNFMNEKFFYFDYNFTEVYS